MSKQFEKLVGLLRELFQLDQPDLDFGIYRIMHAKADELTQFLERDLLPQVKTAFSQYTTADKAELQAALAKAIEQATGLGVDPETSPKVKELRQKLSNESVDVAALEAEVYDHLYSFFRRYYQQGDFLAKRVYKPGVYAIPYEGEEIKLHWANRDQYYIKTSEYLRDYAFTLKPGDAKDPMRVHFRLVDAVEGEHGNVKAAEGKDRAFILATDDPIGEEEGELIIRFEYRPSRLEDWTDEARQAATAAAAKKPPTQKELSAIAVARILGTEGAKLAKWIAELAKPHTKANSEQADHSRLLAHLNRYTARNTFDYFIHKDLGGFLRQELDFYIKNEVMHLDDVESETAARVEQYLSKIKVIRKIASKLVDFLAQLEEFQKKLWLKKKFVVRADYCVRADILPHELQKEVRANAAQLLEWNSLFGLNAPSSESSFAKFIAENPTLTINTALFPEGFQERLISKLEGLDRTVDAILVHSDNLQALRFMSPKLSSRVSCIYIDPPYNTGQDGFIYKDGFKDSSWLAMMGDRLDFARPLLTEKGVLFASINEIERFNLEWLLKEIFGPANRIEEIIWARDTMSNNSPTYSTNHEYVEVFARNRSLVEGDRAMFRDTKPGFLEVMALVESLASSFPPVSEIQEKLRELYQAHRSEHIELAVGQGISKEEAEKSDPWKGLYPYRFAEYRDAEGRFVEESQAKEKQASIWVWREVEPSMPSGKQSDTIKDPDSDNFRFYSPPHPVTGKPCKPPKRGWAFPYRIAPDRPSFEAYNTDARISFKDDHTAIPQLKYFLHEVGTIVSSSVMRQYSDGEPRLENLFGVKGLINNPKPPALIETFVNQTAPDDGLVCDFFAGSGTTGNAVIDANRNSGKARKFVLVEAGAYFDDVLVPRIRKVTFSPEWSEGAASRAPTNEEVKASPKLLKILRLESYEDTLNNLKITRTKTQSDLLSSVTTADTMREAYVLQYMLDVETRGSASLLNIAKFSDPNSYTFKIKRPGSDETSEVVVDLAETFNWLIGLCVEQSAARQQLAAEFKRDAEGRLQLKGRLKETTDGPWWFRTVTGTTPDGRKTLVIWRKLTGDGEQDNLVLDEWFKKQGYSTKDYEFDLIYVNGDNNLENLRQPDETWKVRLIEEDFHRLMFDTTGL